MPYKDDINVGDSIWTFGCSNAKKVFYFLIKQIEAKGDWITQSAEQD